MPGTQFDDLAADGLGNPGVDPVAYNVVELARVGREVHQVHGVQFDVGNAQRLGHALRHLDLSRREVDADEFGAGEHHGRRQDVPAGGAADFQHTATKDLRRSNAENGRNAGHAVGVRFPVGTGRVGSLLVAVENGVGHGLPIRHRRCSRPAPARRSCPCGPARIPGRRNPCSRSRQWPS